jgi:hypothetical protein
VELPTSGQCHLANEATPRNGNLSRGGVSRRSSKNRLLRNSDARPALMVAQQPAAIDILFDVGWDGALASGGVRDFWSRDIQMQSCSSWRKR